MNSYHAPMVALCVAAPILFAACQQALSKSGTEWSGPLPDLNKIEECQRADLQRYLGSTYRFHLYDCWAEVSIDVTNNPKCREVVEFLASLEST
jgi:hypothetical protein